MFKLSVFLNAFERLLVQIWLTFVFDQQLSVHLNLRNGRNISIYECRDVTVMHVFHVFNENISNCRYHLLLSSAAIISITLFQIHVYFAIMHPEGCFFCLALHLPATFGDRVIVVRLSKSLKTLRLGSSKIATVADFTALALLRPLKL